MIWPDIWENHVKQISIESAWAYQELSNTWGVPDTLADFKTAILK